ncbi:MAG: hypothetical protein LBI82_06695 [Dysgonamonadaceae bacterium]|jgi:hypothetical protein|nr:hypothetical protein [Dysgonamonadaceae bacterium]
MYKSIRYFIVIFVLLLFFFSCNWKNKKAEKIFIQVENLIEQNPDSALILLELIEFPEKLNPENYANYLLLRVQAKHKTHRSIAEDTLIHVSISYFLEKKDMPKVVLAYFYSGRIDYERGDNEKAIQDLLFAKDYAEKAKDDNLLGLIHYDLGDLYYEEYNTKSALNNYQYSRKYFLKAGNEKNAVYIQTFIGNVYLTQEPQQTKLALDNYNQVLLYAEQHKDTSQLISILRNIGLAYKEMKDYSRAKEYLFKSIAVDKHGKYSTDNYFILSGIYLSLNLPDSAIYYAGQLSPNVVGNEDYTGLYNYYDLMGNIYTYMSKHEQASECYQKKCEYLDLSYESKIRQSVLDIQEKYDSEKLKNSLQKTELHNQFILNISLLGALVAILLTVFLVIMIKRKKEKIQQIEHNLETMKEMFSDYDENKLSLKQALLEQLDVAKKIAQIHAIPSNTTEYNLNEMYFKIFGKNMAEKLDWNNLYPVIDKLHDGFVKKLRKTYPDLSDKDVQLCCLLRADFKIDEITFILDYNNITTTQTLKNKLRMKMDFLGMKEFLFFLKNM